MLSNDKATSRPDRRCPLLAQSRHELLHCTCLLSGVKRVWSLHSSLFSNLINELLAKHSIAISEKAMS